MKKYIIIGMAICTLFAASACNKQIIDTTWSYKHAIISFPDGTFVKGTVESWTDYEDGDQIQIKIDGTTYLVHSEDVVLISD